MFSESIDIPERTPVVEVFSDAVHPASPRGNRIVVGIVPEGVHKGKLFYRVWLDGGSGSGWVQSGYAPTALLCPGLEQKAEMTAAELLSHIPEYFENTGGVFSDQRNTVPGERVIYLDGGKVIS